ncbi:M48 family metallopeptidase [Priestia taiwanensis]
MRSHTMSNNHINYEIKHKNRTSIRILIDSLGNLEIHVPKGTTEEAIQHFLKGKWDIIEQKVREVKERQNGPKQRNYDEGETFLYLGRNYPIQINHDTTISQDYVVFEGDTLYVYVNVLEDEKVKQALRHFYYKQCKALVEESIAFYQSYFKMKPRSIRITDSKKNWGTCDGERKLTFNWRLAMAPREVLDYVVVHEMCHMMHMNHDRSFWRLVGKIMPDYKEKERWLAVSNWKMTV